LPTDGKTQERPFGWSGIPVVGWQRPEVLVLASHSEPDPNNSTWLVDDQGDIGQGPPVRAGTWVSTDRDRLAQVVDQWIEVGINDRVDPRGSLILAGLIGTDRIVPGHPPTLSTRWDIGRAWANGYTRLSQPALSGGAVFFKEDWNGHLSTLRVASLFNDCTLVSSALAPLRGKPVVLTARVTSKSGAPTAGAMVNFERWNGSRWSVIAGGRTYSHGMRQITVLPGGATTYRVRVGVWTSQDAPIFSSQVRVTPR
jgi:hypothetical protein